MAAGRSRATGCITASSTVDGEKMSKSRSATSSPSATCWSEFPGEAIRLALLRRTIPSAARFHRDRLRQAKGNLDRWYNALRCAGRGFRAVPLMNVATAIAEVPFDVARGA